jgi:hypothetical protein
MTDFHSMKQWALTCTFCVVQGTLWLSPPVTYSDATAYTLGLVTSIPC